MPFRTLKIVTVALLILVPVSHATAQEFRRFTVPNSVTVGLNTQNQLSVRMDYELSISENFYPPLNSFSIICERGDTDAFSVSHGDLLWADSVGTAGVAIGASSQDVIVGTYRADGSLGFIDLDADMTAVVRAILRDAHVLVRYTGDNDEIRFVFEPNLSSDDRLILEEVASRCHDINWGF